jgi:hypothetical protein
MLDMAKSSIILFFKGKLFQNPAEVWRQLAIGVALTLAIFIAAAKLLGLGLPLSGAIAGFIGGAAQPALFRNLKFR